MSPLLRAAAACACGLALVACGTQGPGTATAGSPSERATAGSPAGPESGTPAPTAPADLPTSTAEVAVERGGAEPALVTGVRTGRHDGFDRVVVDFAGPLPGYTAQWADELVQDGSGEPIDLDGDVALHLLLTPADAHTEDGEPTWTAGPVAGSLEVVSRIVKTGDFEGRVGIALVMTSRTPFRVKEYTGPGRLVVDVRH
ncbi:AMIN-like domain-containing (lipo)protein [Nonomuraea sp. SBT364]|uniref:AMIN-like domain-containing (lipo)protein n=1 Tax=Nonomuraea sp. SBT364 TaxID=1580530 RepID=UPI001E5000CF|nr:hypothetical protein [Nonomuraea sp. SBT364]